MGGALAWLLVKEIKEIVVAFTKKKDPNIGERRSDQALSDLFKIAKEMKTMIKDLHDWHDHDDPTNPGSKVWYGKAAADRLATMQEKINLIAKSCGLGGRDDDV